MYLIQSCSESISVIPDSQTKLATTQTSLPDEYIFANTKYKIPAGLTKWEAQLNKMIDNNSLLMKNGLKLLNYKYLRKIVSVYDLETVKRELNADNSFFIIYNNDSITDFTIGKNEAASKNYMKFLNCLLPTSDSAKTVAFYKNETSSLDNSVYIFEESDMEMVGLTWEYNGETLNTTCLVSKKKGFVYDKLLYFIPYATKQCTEVKSSFSLKSYLDTTPGPPPVIDVAHTDNYNDGANNYFNNVELWRYNITVTLHGLRIAGVNTVTNASASYNAHGLSSDEPAHLIYGTYDCVASVQIIEVKDGPGGYVRYAYAWSWKHGGSVSLSWNGVGYDAKGGGTCGGGYGAITASELN